MPGSASNDDFITAPDARPVALRDRVQLALALLGVTLVIAIVYLVGWSIQLFVLSVLTLGVGLISVLVDRRRRGLAPSGVDELEAPDEGGHAEYPGFAPRAQRLPYLLVTTLIDLAFLLIWAFVAYLGALFFNWLERIAPLTGFNRLVLGILQISFTVSTLIPIIVFLIKDVIRVIRGPNSSSDHSSSG